MKDAPAIHFLPITAINAVEMSSDPAVYGVDEPPASNKGPSDRCLIVFDPLRHATCQLKA